MEKEIIIYDKKNKPLKCNVLIEFTYDSENYIVYTDNTYDKKGIFNLYKAHIDSDNKLSDPTDVDVEEIFDKLITDYKNKVARGEIW